MPQYFCNQCGAPVETGDSFAPPDTTSCPACRGEVPPLAREQEPAAMPQQAPPLPRVQAQPLPPALPPRPVPNYPYVAPGQDPLRPAKAKNYTAWVLVSTIVAGAIGVVGYSFNSRMVDKGPGYLVGTGIGATAVLAAMGLVVGLLVALIALPFKKPFRESLARGYCLSVILLAIFSLLGNLSTASLLQRKQAKQAQVQETKEAFQGMAEDLDRMVAETRDADGMPKQSDFRLESEVPTDSISSLRHLIQSVLNDTIQLQNDYLAAINKDGLPTLLVGERLAKDKDLKESRAIVERSRLRVEEFRGKAMDLVDGISKRLDRYPLSAADKRDFLRGHNEQKARKMADLKANWDSEAEAINLMSKLVDHLEATKAEWSVQDGTILFETDEGLAGFQDIVKKIDECTTRQREQQRKAVEETKSNLNDFQKDLDKE